MKRILLLLLVMILLNSYAQSSELSVSENWYKIEETFTHEDISIIVDADCLTLPPSSKVAEYKTYPLDFSVSKRIAQTIPWTQIGFSETTGKWIKDGDSYYYSDHENDTMFGIFTFCQLRAFNHGVVSSSPYRFIAAVEDYEVNYDDIGVLSEDYIYEIATNIASLAGLQIGSPIKMKKCNDFFTQGYLYDENFEKWHALFFPDLNDSDAKTLQTFELFYPAYYNGIRLYSGNSMSLQGESFIPEMYFNIEFDFRGNLIHVVCPILKEMDAISKLSSPIPIEDAICLFDSIYSDLFLPDVTAIVVHNISLEYVAISGDQTASKGFNIYPCWVFRISYKNNDQVLWEEYVGIHAIFGNQVF